MVCDIHYDVIKGLCHTTKTIDISCVRNRRTLTVDRPGILFGMSCVVVFSREVEAANSPRVENRRKKRGAFTEYENEFYDAFSEFYDPIRTIANRYEKDLGIVTETKIEVSGMNRMRAGKFLIRQMDSFRPGASESTKRFDQDKRVKMPRHGLVSHSDGMRDCSGRVRQRV